MTIQVYLKGNNPKHVCVYIVNTCKESVVGPYKDINVLVKGGLILTH